MNFPAQYYFVPFLAVFVIFAYIYFLMRRSSGKYDFNQTVVAQAGAGLSALGFITVNSSLEPYSTGAYPWFMVLLAVLAAALLFIFQRRERLMWVVLVGATLLLLATHHQFHEGDAQYREATRNTFSQPGQ